nr:EOG090X01FD [Lepidurus arcticus]
MSVKKIPYFSLFCERGQPGDGAILEGGVTVKVTALKDTHYNETDLVKCLLQQIFIGPNPNQLLLSYLTCLLESHKKVQAHNEEDAFSLALSFLSSGHWLFNVAKEALTRLLDMSLHSEEHSLILNLSSALLQDMLTWEFSNVMLVLSKWHDQNLSENLAKGIKCLRDVSNQCSDIEGAPQSFRECIEQLKTICTKWENLSKPVAASKPWLETVNSGIHVLVTMEALKNHSINLDEFLNRIMLLKRLKGCSMETVYSELVRASCLGLMDTSETCHELKFDVFTFLVIPTVFKRLHHLVGDSNNANEVYNGLECCAQNSTLFDLTDLKCNCNTLETLLEEIKKRSELLDDRQVQMLLAEREAANFPKIHPVTAQGATLILRADSTVNSILKTLDADYSKTQDSLFSVLSHLLSGKSLELILSAATGTGKLPQFAARLIRFNERNSKAGSNADANSKTPHTRAILFDICFLMLCHMAQTYGPEVISMAGQADSFFEQWCALNMVEQPNLEALLSKADNGKVEHLLTFCTSQDIDIRTSNVKWPDLCWSLPAALKETMNSWEVQEDLKACSTARNRESARQKQLNKIREQSPLSRQHISKAELEWQQASADSARLGKALEERLDRFEQLKLTDLKRILSKFIEIELGHHAKALQLMSLAFNQVEQIDIEEDLEAFRNIIRMPESSTGTDSVPQTPKKSLFNFIRTGSTPTLSSTPRAPQALPRSKSFTEPRNRPNVSFASPILKEKSLSKDSLKVEDYEEIGSSEDTED